MDNRESFLRVVFVDGRRRNRSKNRGSVSKESDAASSGSGGTACRAAVACGDGARTTTTMTMKRELRICTTSTIYSWLNFFFDRIRRRSWFASGDTRAVLNLIGRLMILVYGTEFLQASCTRRCRSCRIVIGYASLTRLQGARFYARFQPSARETRRGAQAGNRRRKSARH